MSHRLIDLVAEDNAIEDTIYHLHRALNAGRIDLDRFLRVRVVSACTFECARADSYCFARRRKYRRPVFSPKSSS
jgi:hypothetical protein